MSRILILIALSATLSMAQTNKASMTRHTQAEWSAHHAKIEAAIAAKDYKVWKTEHDAFAPAGNPLSHVVTAENFPKFIEMRTARLAGDFTKANQLRTELGLRAMGAGYGQGHGQGWRSGKHQQGYGMGKGWRSCTK
ncbi:MAG TPA: hypothetical protein VLM37_09530 [Fibrobacteraceae bacterium]|nr:hypothetical protein [Fibrobacteraceae bacterium]